MKRVLIVNGDWGKVFQSINRLEMLLLGQLSIIVVIIFRAERVGSETMLAQGVDFNEESSNESFPIPRQDFRILYSSCHLGTSYFWVWFVLLGDSFVTTLQVAVLIIACLVRVATPTVLVGTGQKCQDGVLLKNGTV